MFIIKLYDRMNHFYLSTVFTNHVYLLKSWYSDKINSSTFSYHSYDCYVRKCRQVNILPLSCRFDLNDLILFQKVVNNYIPVNVPPHLKLYSGGTRIHSTHSDYLCYTSNIYTKSSSSSLLNKSFLHRT